MGRAAGTVQGAPPLIRLSGNTAPHGPSPAAIAAIREVASEVHLYPDRQSNNLSQMFGDIEGVDPSEVAPTAGSAGAILDLVRQAANGTGKLVAYDQSFHLYSRAASYAGAAYDTVPVGTSFERDIEAFLDHIDDDARVAIIDNPPNPTSDTLKPDELDWLLTRISNDTLVILDEAYHHFADGQPGYASMMNSRDVHPRLIVTRTMSKAFGLAGQRIGYAVGPADILAPLKVQRIPFSITNTSEAAAIAALEDEAHTAKNIAAVAAAKQRMTVSLRELGLVVLETNGNFILVRVANKADVVAAFKDRGILVNGLGLYNMPDFIRVSAGSPADVLAFLDAAVDVLSPK